MIELQREGRNGPIDIHRHWVKVYGVDAADASTVKRWAGRIESGDRADDDKVCSGPPHTATTPENDALIRADRRITLNEMRAELDPRG